MNDWRFAFVGLFRSWKTRALRSACKMEWKERVNVELPQTGEQNLSIFVKTDEWLRFVSFWGCFDAGKRVHYVLYVKWSEKGIWTWNYLKRNRNYD